MVKFVRKKYKLQKKELKDDIKIIIKRNESLLKRKKEINKLLNELKDKIENYDYNQDNFLNNINFNFNLNSLNQDKSNNRYSNEKIIEINNKEKKNDYNDSMVKNSQFSNKNYGNSLDNQLKVKTDSFLRKIKTIESENQSSSGANNGAN